MDQEILTIVNNSIVAVITVLGAISAAIWFSMIIWTFKDMRSRSRDIFAQILAAVLSGVLPVVGIFVYLLLRPTRTLAEAFEMAIEQEVLLQDIETKRHCPNCKRKAKDNWVLCPHCYVQLQEKCRHCGELKEMGWAMCPACADGVLDPIPQPQISVGTPSYIRESASILNGYEEKTIVIDGSLVQPVAVNGRMENGNGRLFNRPINTPPPMKHHTELPLRQAIPNVQWKSSNVSKESQVRLTKRKGSQRRPTYRNGNQ